MNPEKYSKLPIDPVVTELYRHGSNPGFDFPPPAARLLDILAAGARPQGPRTRLRLHIPGSTPEAGAERSEGAILTLPAGRGSRRPVSTPDQD